MQVFTDCRNKYVSKIIQITSHALDQWLSTTHDIFITEFIVITFTKITKPTTFISFTTHQTFSSCWTTRIYTLSSFRTFACCTVTVCSKIRIMKFALQIFAVIHVLRSLSVADSYAPHVDVECQIYTRHYDSNSSLNLRSIIICLLTSKVLLTT